MKVSSWNNQKKRGPDQSRPEKFAVSIAHFHGPTFMVLRLLQQFQIVFKGPVWSGFSARFGWTATAIGCLLWQDPKKPVQTGPDRFF